jgi:signal transduction histidine kinase
MFLAAMTLSNNSAWFYNEGLLGSTPFLFGFAVMGIPFIYDRHQKKVLGFVALNVLLLIIVQHFFPGSVIGYPDGFSRFVDLASVFMFYLAITGITIYVFNRMYRKEKRTIEKQNRMLEHQKIELAEKNIRLEELTRNKELITGMIIHDLKNPLTTILGLSDQYSSAESMKRVNHSGKQMLDLVMNILDVQKFESARMEINRMPTCFPRSCGNRFPDFLIPSMKKT